ncbi:MAG TPA: protein kinase [Pirellulales bacterium]|jgi:serine/threonine protein kinase/tetratricopeptide (TPR) repeat protein
MNEREIFIQALQIDEPLLRSSRVRELCAGNESLRARVESLLEAHGNAVGFLESPACGVATIERQIFEQPGTQIGPYKLLEQIGEGGMGAVYMADQQTPVRRRVALKIIKPGMDTRQVIARFEAERQALALMDHPNIAHVLDAGATDTGRPYFVMELVRGVPITEYCDEVNLSVAERLEMFVQVCQAVQHAHQKGIIHRDIKPSNVLVTLLDGRAVPKVIDFGVAKAVNQQLTEKTLFTSFSQLIGTPLYMSPEQAEMPGLDVDTRSDIYSLGVLLFELLTGATPFDKTRVREATYDELRRIIREEEPRRPSAFVETLGHTRTIAASRRRVHPERLAQVLCGDLDWIVMKALEKNRRRRYATASGLARDIERYLRDEPIEARPPSAIYRFQKFARRNRAAITTVALVCAALICGTIVSTWQAVRATHAERLAEARLTAETAARGDAENARAAESQQRAIAEMERNEAESQRARAEVSFQAARQVVDERFDAVHDDELLSIPALQPLRKEQLASTLGYYRQFIALYRDDPTVKSQLAATYRRMGGIARATGDDPQSILALQEAVQRYEDLLRSDPMPHAIRSDLAGTLYELGLVQNEMSQPSDAAASFQRALDVLAELELDAPADDEQRRMKARVCANLGVALNVIGRSAQGEKTLRQALAAYEILGDDERDLTQSRLFRSDVARAHYQLGVSLRARGRGTDAEASFRDAIATYESLVADAPAVPTYRGNLARACHELGSLYRINGRLAEAEALHRRALALYERAASENPTVAEYHMGLGWAHYKLGCHQFAMQDRGQAEQNWTIAQQQFAAAVDLGFNPTGAYKALGDVRAMLGRWQEAADSYARVAEAYQFAALPTLQWALLQLAAGDQAGYRAACDRVVSDVAATAEGNLALLIVMTCIAGDAAVSNPSAVVELAQHLVAHDPRNPVGQVFLAAAQFRAGETVQAVAALRAALPRLALAELAAPTKRDYVRLARLAGETILALAYEKLDDRESLIQQLVQWRAAVDAVAARPPQYSDRTNEWTLPLAIHIARSECGRLESPVDSSEAK